MACYSEPNAWVLASRRCGLDDLTRLLPEGRQERLVHLTFDGDAGTLSFQGDRLELPPLTGIFGDHIYPVVGGYQNAEVQVLHSQSSTSIVTAPFPSRDNYICSLLHDTQEADVVLTVGNEEILAHSLLLKRIPYFQRMLSGSFAESRKRKSGDMANDDSRRYNIAIHDSSADAMKQVLKFIYTDDTKLVLGGLQHGELITLARVADMYGLSPLFEAACQMLEQIAKDASLPEVCLDALEFAHRHERLSLRRSMLALVGRRFEEVALTDRFKALPQTNAELYTEIIKEIVRNIKK